MPTQKEMLAINEGYFIGIMDMCKDGGCWIWIDEQEEFTVKREGHIFTPKTKRGMKRLKGIVSKKWFNAHVSY